MIAPKSKMSEIIEIAKKAVQDWTPGDPATAKMGPVVSEAQWNKIQGLIEKGAAEGATIIAGGPGKPEGLETGYYVKPTIFADVTNDMTIARQEIFGPVLVIIGYDTEDEAIRIANDTEYGLAGYVQSGDIDHARKVASKIRAGYININNSQMDFSVPFGGYKRSGNGREGEQQQSRATSINAPDAGSSCLASGRQEGRVVDVVGVILQFDQRRGDIPVIAQHAAMAGGNGKAVPGLAASPASALLQVEVSGADRQHPAAALLRLDR